MDQIKDSGIFFDQILQTTRKMLGHHDIQISLVMEVRYLFVLLVIFCLLCIIYGALLCLCHANLCLRKIKVCKKSLETDSDNFVINSNR